MEISFKMFSKYKKICSYPQMRLTDVTLGLVGTRNYKILSLGKIFK
jgi:hypothetical protein